MTAAAFDYGYEDGNDLTSYVTVRHGRYSYDLVDRVTETAGLDRRAYGGQQRATDSQAETSTKQNDLLKCSDCKEMCHFEQFSLSSIFLHRHALWIETKKNGKKVGKLMGRGYQCSACQKKRRDEAAKARMDEALAESRKKRQAAKQAKQAKQSGKKGKRRK